MMKPLKGKDNYIETVLPQRKFRFTLLFLIKNVVPILTVHFIADIKKHLYAAIFRFTTNKAQLRGAVFIKYCK
jgi:hypothetical protein